MGGTEELSDTPYTESMHIDSAHAFKEDQDQDDDRASSDSSNDSKYEEELLQDDEFDVSSIFIFESLILYSSSLKRLFLTLILSSILASLYLYFYIRKCSILSQRQKSDLRTAARHFGIASSRIPPQHPITTASEDRAE